MMIETATDAQGRQWHPFDVVWTSLDGQFCTIIYATDADHAARMLQALQKTARVEGEILEALPR